MTSFFMNPITMWVGAGLVAVPIIIHLINRMRFRRVKWAAMEFLLKAQRKMRRKKILEQLLLLLLRCLLVFLLGMLFARFLGLDPFEGKETRPVLHVVVLDDTPSMADTGGDGGAPGSDAFSTARSHITDRLLPAILKADTPQRLRIIRLTDRSDILNPPGPSGSDPEPQLVSAQLVDQVKALLAQEKPATVRAGLPPALQKAKQYLDRAAGNDTAKVVYVYSDMRSVDWQRDAEAIGQVVQEMTESGAEVHLIDVASPYRRPDRKNPAFSDNVGILELKPRSRVVALGKEVEFEVRVRNFGSTDLKNVGLRFFLNGEGRWITSRGFEVLPANQERTEIVTVQFVPGQATTLASRENPLGRFNVVTAKLENIGADALAADNVRHAVVEVRDKLAVLVVTRPEDKPDDKNGDSFYLRNLFELKFSGVDWVSGGPDALEKRDLREFSSIYLLNIPQLTEGQIRNLEQYAREGGGVGIFLGPDVKPDAYTNLFYRKGEGLFPFPLPNAPTEPLSFEAKLKRTASFAKRILIRDSAAKAHPALVGIYQDAGARGSKETADQVERQFYLPAIDQHWKIERIGKWREDRAIQELYCLPNEQPMSDFEARAVRLIEAIREKYAEPKFERYRPVVDAVLERIREVAGDVNNPPLTKLVDQLDRLLSDQVTSGDADEALLREFWGHGELAEVKQQAEALRDSTKYGDPLYVARRFGAGRVAVFTIPVGAPWTDWPSGPGASGWVAVMTELQKYLSGGGSDENRTVGSPFEATYEPGRYKPVVEWSFLTYDPLKADKASGNAEAVRDPVPGQPAKELPLDAQQGALRFAFTDTRRPGVYTFKLVWQKRDGDPANAPPTKDEYLARAFNFDTEREGDLKRTSTDDFKAAAKSVEEVHSPDDDRWLDRLEQRPSDLSSGRWIFLLILMVLVFEQAMAVRLSYHRKPDDLLAFAPTAAAALAGRSNLVTGAETAETTPAA